jgi:hypothetical protein
LFLDYFEYSSPRSIHRPQKIHEQYNNGNQRWRSNINIFNNYNDDDEMVVIGPGVVIGGTLGDNSSPGPADNNMHVVTKYRISLIEASSSQRLFARVPDQRTTLFGSWNPGKCWTLFSTATSSSTTPAVATKKKDVETRCLYWFTLRTKDDIIKTNMTLDMSNHQFRHNNDQHIAATML